MKRTLMVGLSVIAGAALLETVLIPGLAIGGAVVLAPKVLPGLRRSLKPLFKSKPRRRTDAAVSRPKRPEVRAPLALLTDSPMKRAIAKTISFRVIVTTLDFTANYIVIDELGAAAGLSAFALVAGPLFYLLHELAWDKSESSEIVVDLPVLLPGRTTAKASPTGRRKLTMSRALAKTITFRTFATAADFTANYVVVGDLAIAAGLSAFGFVVGPFVYLGHEKVWDYYGSPREHRPELAAPGPA
jgi:uncharacterized membrane protein